MPFRMTSVVALTFFLISGPLYAAPEDLSRQEPPRSDEAQETSQRESNYVNLLKQIRVSPSQAHLAKKAEKQRAVLYRQNLRIGEKLEKEGYLLSAAGYYRRALLYDPESSSAKKALARAKESLARIDREGSDEAYRQGVEAYTSGDKKGAAEAWTKALKLNSQNQDAQAALEKIDPRPEPVPEAVPPKDEIPQDPDVRESLWGQNFREGLERERLGENEAAEKLFKEALRDSPNDESTQSALARVEVILGKARRQKSQDLYLLGVRSLDRLDYRSAYQYLHDAVEADPGNQPARALLGNLTRQRPEVLKKSLSQPPSGP
jgi:tetratricopeptide (TPR) repeat protein